MAKEAREVVDDGLGEVFLAEAPHPHLTARIEVRARPDDVARWSELARERGLSVSAWLRLRANGQRLPGTIALRDLEAVARWRVYAAAALPAMMMRDQTHRSAETLCEAAASYADLMLREEEKRHSGG